MNKLTREEILAMEPGEGLDDLIATKVMCWQAKSKKWGGECDEYEDFWHDGDRYMFECAHFSPSTDISAAWEVVEKMYSWGGCDIGCYGKGGTGKWITVSTHTLSAGDVRVYAHTAPEAICKAALLALLEDSSLPGEETTP